MEPDTEALPRVLDEFLRELVTLLYQQLVVADVIRHRKLVEGVDHIFCLQLPRFEVFDLLTHPGLQLSNFVLETCYLHVGLSNFLILPPFCQLQRFLKLVFHFLFSLYSVSPH